MIKVSQNPKLGITRFIWKTKNGIRIHIKNMTNNHLFNVHQLLERYSHQIEYVIGMEPGDEFEFVEVPDIAYEIEKELERRGITKFDHIS
jgi:hypothetical protein